LVTNAQSSDSAAAASGKKALTKAQDIMETDNASSSSINSSLSTLKSIKDQGGQVSEYFSTKKSYYDSLSKGDLENENTMTYDEYLKNKIEENKFTAMDAYGAHAVTGSRSNLWTWKWGEDFDVTIAGKTDEDVDIGEKVSSSNLKKMLEYVNSNTGNTGYVYVEPEPLQMKSGEGVIYMRQNSESWWPIKNEDKPWNGSDTAADAIPDGLRNAATAEIEGKDT
jgi:hypothetical protein